MFYTLTYRKQYSPTEKTLGERIEEARLETDTLKPDVDIITGVVVEPNQTLIVAVVYIKENKMPKSIDGYTLVSTIIYEPPRTLD